MHTIRTASGPHAYCLPRRLSLMTQLSDEELDALVEKATIDAYDDGEQISRFAVMIDDNLEFPFETTVLGVTVTVKGVEQTDSGIVADYVRDGQRQLQIAPSTLLRWLNDGFIAGEQVTPGAPWRIRLTGQLKIGRASCRERV